MSDERKKGGFDSQRESDLGAIAQGMDNETFASGIPREHQSMTDKLDSHKSGSVFKYAVITNSPSSERSSMLSKLRSYRPQTKISTLTLAEIPNLRMVGDTIAFPLKSSMSQDILRTAEDYMLIDCVLVHFVPLDSFANDKSVITVQINDFRKTSNQTVRSAKIDNTMGYNILFYMDYCVETKDADRLVLSFACPCKDFQAGVAWGAVKVVAQVQFMSFPRRAPLVETAGVALLSDTDLDNFQCDPREIDLVLTPQAMIRMREANQRSEIENLTLPKDDKVEMITAKTILGDGYQVEDVGDAIGKMRELAIMKQRQENAKAENQKKLNSLKSGMTQPVVTSMKSPTASVMEEGSEDVVRVDESASNFGEGDSITTEDIGRTPGGNRVTFS